MLERISGKIPGLLVAFILSAVGSAQAQSTGQPDQTSGEIEFTEGQFDSLADSPAIGSRFEYETYELQPNETISRWESKSKNGVLFREVWTEKDGTYRAQIGIGARF